MNRRSSVCGLWQSGTIRQDVEGFTLSVSLWANSMGVVLDKIAESAPKYRQAQDLVAIRDLPFHSMCEHHLLRAISQTRSLAPAARALPCNCLAFTRLALDEVRLQHSFCSICFCCLLGCDQRAAICRCLDAVVQTWPSFGQVWPASAKF